MMTAEKKVPISTLKMVRPILVTGSPRSGTTWVGKMLALSDQLHYISEPFNPNYPLGISITKIKFPCFMKYISEELNNYKSDYYKPFKKLIDGKCDLLKGYSHCRSVKDLVHVHRDHRDFLKFRQQGKLPLLKDPIAIMSAGWLARTFDMQVVVMVRHPAAVVSSMKRLNWSFDPRNWALSQPLLLRDHLAPYEAELKHIADSNADLVDRIALLWKVIYYVVTNYQMQYPNWIFLRHEDIAKDPLHSFEILYRNLDLNYSESVKRKIFEFTNEGNPTHNKGKDKGLKLNSKKVVKYWQQVLSGDEIRRIRNRVEEVSKFFYGDEDWDLDKRHSPLPDYL